jgi:hypothetical protein
MTRLLLVELVCVTAFGCGGIIDGGGNGSSGHVDGDAGGGDGATADESSLCALSDCGTNFLSGCISDGCPSGNDACIEFFPRGSLIDRRPACGVSSCIPICETSLDCSDGYECVSPRSAPWSAVAAILDNDQAELVCLPSLCGSP